MAGDLGHSRSVSLRLRSLFFFLVSSSCIVMSLAQNNKALLDQISKLVADSAENIKRSSEEAADDQSREIKKLRREERKSLTVKGTKSNTNSIPSFRIRWRMSNRISKRTQSTKLKRPFQKVRHCSPKGKS